MRDWVEDFLLYCAAVLASAFIGKIFSGSILGEITGAAIGLATLLSEGLSPKKEKAQS